MLFYYTHNYFDIVEFETGVIFPPGYAPEENYFESELRTYPMLHDTNFDLTEERQHFAAAGFSPLVIP